MDATIDKDRRSRCRPRHQLRRGVPRLASRRLPELRRARRPDRGDAPHPGRGEELDLRRAVSCTRSTTACCCPAPRRSSLRPISAGCCTGPPAASWRAACSSCPASSPSWRLSYIYAAYGNVGFVEALFFGLKAAVLAIVIEAVVRVGKRALRNNVMIAVAAVGIHRDLLLRRALPRHHRRGRRDRLSRRQERTSRICRQRAWRRQRRGGGRQHARRTTARSRPTRPNARAPRRRGLAVAVARAGRRAPDLFSGRPMCSPRSRCSSARWRW